MLQRVVLNCPGLRSAVPAVPVLTAPILSFPDPYGKSFAGKSPSSGTGYSFTQAHGSIRRSHFVVKRFTAIRCIRISKMQLQENFRELPSKMSGLGSEHN